MIQLAGNPFDAPGSDDARWRSLLLLVLPIGFMAFTIAFAFNLLDPASATLFDWATYPLFGPGILLLVLLLWRSPRSTRAVAMATICSLSLFFLSKILYLLFLVSPGIDITKELTETFFWVPSVYLLSFFMPRMQRARQVCLAFMGLMFCASIVYTLPRLLAGSHADVIEALLQLNLANGTMLLVTRTATGLMHARADSMAHLATTDALTGLRNRRFLQSYLHDAIAQARHRGGALALVFLDLDNFKDINDQYGHAAGDALLQRVAEQLQTTTRGADLVVRVSGDEFIIVAAIDTREQAQKVARRALDAVARDLTLPGGRLVRVTASIGVSTYPFDATTAEELLAGADKAMYNVKSAGRNGVGQFTR